MSWRLKRTTQCAKCPWRTDVNPREIPGGYDEKKHAALKSTIALPGYLNLLDDTLRVMACHETDSCHCVGWLNHQIGQGNNLSLRMHVMTCSNLKDLRVIGEQHARFEDTLPQGWEEKSEPNKNHAKQNHQARENIQAAVIAV